MLMTMVLSRKSSVIVKATPLLAGPGMDGSERKCPGLVPGNQTTRLLDSSSVCSGSGQWISSVVDAQCNGGARTEFRGLTLVRLSTALNSEFLVEQAVDHKL